MLAMDDKVVYKELSYKIVGLLFEVYNALGYGYQERYYERALAKCFKDEGISFKQQVQYRIMFRDEEIGRYQLDFMVDNKIVLELKRGARFSKRSIEQVKGYLKVTGLQLAILANFTPQGVNFLRILNTGDL
ncbi:MAG: GxxExxY protein [Parcubacteria group bacterium]|nr:GxxExxY protein [Parcubacteria group bacterium]|tara:strand:+ start:530 stop:925 length:396 start_codon:yes stop_codon:yes gene_type:complete